MIKNLDKLIAQHEQIGREIELAQAELVNEIKKLLGDKSPTEQELEALGTSLAHKYGIDPVYAVRVIQCEIPFTMEVGVLIQANNDELDDRERYAGANYDECRGY